MSENQQSQSPSQSTATPKPELLKASGITGSMTLVSRVLGLARDVTIARLFGTSDGADVFFVANKIPNFMRRLFAEGAFNQAFVPVLSEYRTTKSLSEVQSLIQAVSASLGGFLALLTTIVLLTTPIIALPFFSNEPAKFELLVDMLRITFPYLLLISMAALCSATLNSFGRFAIPALTPALLNVSLIASAFLLSPYFTTPELSLAWGVLIAGFAQFIFQLPFLARMNLLPIPKIHKNHEGLRRIKRLMLPGLFGVSVSQINLLFDTFIATLLVSGSVSWLYYSDRLMELPLGTFGIAIGIVVLPSLSRSHAEKSQSDFAKTLDWAFRIVCLIAIPATLALVLISEPLLITLFQNDKFDVSDVVESSASLRAYSIGLLAFMAIKIFAPGFYARQNTSTPVRIGIIAMVANMLMNLGFYLLGFAHVGLALATSLAAFLNAGLLLAGLYKENIFKLSPGWPLFVLRLIVANAAMVFFLLLLTGEWMQWLELDLLQRILKLSGLVVGGITVYVVCLFLLGLRGRDVYH